MAIDTATPAVAIEPQSRYFDTEHLKTDLKGRTVRGGVVTLGSQGFRLVVTTIQTAILARLLMPADFGLIAMVTVITGFVQMFRDAGLSMATIQRERVTHEQVSTLFWINVAISAFLMGVVMALAPLIARFYDEPRLVPITLAFSGTFLLGGLAVQHTALMKRHMRFTALGAIQIVSTLAAAAGAIALAALTDIGYWALVWMYVINAAVSCLMAWIMSPWLPGPPRRKTGVRPMLAFGGSLTVSSLLTYVTRNGDNMLIGWWCGAGPLGLYAKAYSLLMLPIHQVNAPVAAVAIPALSRLQTEPRRYRRAYLSILEKIAFAAVPVGLFVACTSDWLIDIFLGPRWGGARPILLWLCLAGLTQPISNTVGWLLITQERSKELVQWGVINSILTVLSFVAGLPWGPVGVAASYSVSGLILRLPILYWMVGRSGPVSARDLYRVLFLSFIPAASAALVILGIRAVLPDGLSSVVSLLIATPFAVAAAMASLSLFPAGRSALAEVGRLISKRKVRS